MKRRYCIVNKKEISEKILIILKKILEDDEKLPRTFDESISKNIDSLEFVLIIIEVEKTFEIEIDDKDFEIENVDSVNKLTDIIQKYIG